MATNLIRLTQTYAPACTTIHVVIDSTGPAAQSTSANFHPTLAEAILNRLLNASHRITLNGESPRRQKR